jgi:hypothetical protein
MRPMDWVFFAQKLIIPEKPRPDIHESHLGMEKCRSRAISVINRPGMSADIERLVAKWSTCLKHQRSNQKEPQNLHTVPARAWQKLGTDIFEYKSKPYLVIVDYYSNIQKFVSFIKQYKYMFRIPIHRETFSDFKRHVLVTTEHSFGIITR